MSLAALARVALDADLAAVIDAVPAGPGVGQLLGPGGRSLLVGTASSLRRWAASHLGLVHARPRPGAPARRPKTSLAGIAAEIAWLETDGPFRQRLVYERLCAAAEPPPARRDLKPPVFLHLDPAERFPRVSVREGGGERQYGPFRDRRAAQKAQDLVQRRYQLRPCDYRFEPDEALPLGLGCLYAQVRSCAAPCLKRTSEDAYRELARRAADWLAKPLAREEAPAVPGTIAAASGRVLIVDRGRRSVGLFPLVDGRVLESAAVVVGGAGELDAAVRRLAWPESDGPSDWPWLTAWLRSPRARAAFVVVPDDWSEAELVAAVRAAAAAASRSASAAKAAGDNVGTTRGEA